VETAATANPSQQRAVVSAGGLQYGAVDPCASCNQQEKSR